jgi:diguanylate cyclase (GGDEF)-like protein
VLVATANLVLAIVALAVPWPTSVNLRMTEPLRLAIAVIAVTIAAGLLYRARRYPGHGADERGGWGRFTEIIRRLDEPDEEAVARAAVRGARQLFPVTDAEVGVLQPDGDWLWYRDAAPGAPGPDTPMQVAPERVVRRTLRAGGSAVGGLGLAFARPVRLRGREQMQLSVFADAVAGALRDAAARRELRDLSDRGRDDAHRDTLTGTGNRAAILAQGDAALRELDRTSMVAFLLLDIDRFKEVNDSLGRAAGDELLRVATDRISAWRHPGELIARLGGDEFGVLLSALPVPAGEPAAALEHAVRRARELSDLLGAPSEVSGMRVVLEASVGVAVAAAGGAGTSELLRRAETAMYRAKSGHTAVAWHDGSGGAPALGGHAPGGDGSDLGGAERLALAAELREALISGDELSLMLQPIVDLRNGAPVAVEALVRWQHPRRGELYPAAFLDMLNDSQLLPPFTGLVLDRALALAAEWAALGLPVPVSVNLSPRSLLDTGLAERIALLLAGHGVPADRLILEITENALVPESGTVTAVLARVRRAGVRLAVDDFGTGYSSMTFLTRERVDVIKIDRSFITRMTHSPEALAIVRTLVQLARSLGIAVVAEGVETAQQAALLVELGCDAAQGYHFHRPMPPPEIPEVLRRAGSR